MQTEIYSSGSPNPASVGIGELINVLFNKTFSAAVRCLLTYAGQNSQTGLQMTFTVTLFRGGFAEQLFVSMAPHHTKEYHLGTFDFRIGDRITVSAASFDASEGEVAAAMFLDVG
jgi:hypothetical protein